MLEKINQIIYEWDPIDLHDCGVPYDEYINEAKLINNALSIIDNANDLAKLIYQEFIDSFGKNEFKKDIDECKQIADIILNTCK